MSAQLASPVQSFFVRDSGLCGCLCSSLRFRERMTLRPQQLPNWWLADQHWVRRPPRKIRSAFAYFVQANFRRLGRILGTRMPQPIFRALGQVWRNCSEEERRPYRERNLDDRERYRNLKDRWSKTFKGRLPRMRRKPKPVDAPKRSRNPYMIFTKDMWSRVSEQFPTWPQEEIVTEIAKRWRELPESEKESFRKRSEEDKQRFATEMREYRRTMFHQVALSRVHNLEIRLSCIRQQNAIKRMEQAAVRPGPPPRPQLQAA